MSLEIVMPAHNEQHRIEATLLAYRRALTGDDVVFTVAMDDCTDGTAAIVERHAAEDPRVRWVEFPRLGKGGVLAEAFRRSTADHVGFVDADCATPPEELQVLLDTVRHTGAGVAIASRWHPSSVVPTGRSLGRRFASVGFAFAVRTVFRMPFTDTQCGAKVLSRSAAHRIAPLLSSRDFVFDVDLLLTARALNIAVAEVPTVWIDRDGSRVQVGHDTLRMAASLARLWLHHRVIPVKMPSRPALEAVATPVAVPATAVPATTVAATAVLADVRPAVPAEAADTTPVRRDSALPGPREALVPVPRATTPPTELSRAS